MAEISDMLESCELKSSSLLLTPEILNRGVLKPHFVFEGKIHKECPPSPQFVDDKRETIHRFWLDSYVKTINTTICHVQDWFAKISSSNKQKFLREVISLMTGSKKLFDIAYFIGPPTKDMIYARTQFTKSPYDVAATDHNRAVNEVLYRDLATYYFNWFQSLNPREQFVAVVGLAHLGGSAIQENVYNDVVKILMAKQEELLRRKVLEYMASQKNALKIKARQSRRGRSVKSKVGLRNDSKKTSKKGSIKSKSSKKASVSIEQAGPEKIIQDGMNAFNEALSNMKDIAAAKPTQTENRKHSRVQSSRKSVGKKKSTSRATAGMDRVQMLPLWNNRKIISLLPKEKLHSLSSVNKYWREMVHKTQREIHVRERIDHMVSSLTSSVIAAKPRKGHLKDLTKVKGSNHDITSKVAKGHVDETTVETNYRHLDVSEVYPSPVLKSNPFAREHSDTSICKRYSCKRLMDVTKHWVAYSLVTDIEIKHNAQTGPTNLRLADVHDKITCMSFHTDGVHIFTGGNDGHLKLFDFWHLKLIYPKHKGAITSISNNCRYVASCDTDSVIKVFNIGDGKTIFCIVEEKLSPCRLVITDCKHPSLYVGNANGRISMFNVRPAHKAGKIGDSIDAHHGEITSISHYPCIVITTGVDGYVRIWASNFGTPCWIVSLKHPTPVNSALLSHKKIVSAGDDGKLRIWDVMTSSCVKIITVAPNLKPILSLNCVHTPSTVRLFVNTEAEIRLLEFGTPFKRKMIATKFNRSRRLGARFKRTSVGRKPVTSLERREMGHLMREAVVPQIKPYSDYII